MIDIEKANGKDRADEDTGVWDYGKFGLGLSGLYETRQDYYNCFNTHLKINSHNNQFRKPFGKKEVYEK
ncbi:MAG: hypothetical protein A7315_09050 [Candidatus Altiarchaeales archaeon WOR_SM1_79]|nr:MAG: hypothetical protein A7315_09050 [Candidatus Altiarchaeales archaeon WOR_SM1_79]